MRIAVDAMGGDHGPAVTVPAVIEILDRHTAHSVILVGDETEVKAELKDAYHRFGHRLTVRHTTQRVEMHDPPSMSMRKRDSSLRVAINLVKEGGCDGCVSAGNTGALMATARLVLGTLPGVDRPAICTALPGINGHTHVLDLGANIDSPPEALFQFAVMGSVLVSALENKERPTVGLLNIGVEEIKGLDRIKRAATLLQASHLNYVGFVEGDAIYQGSVDVVVCDGFDGNVAIKSSEGVAKMIMHFAREEYGRTPLTRLAGLLSKPVLRAIKHRIDPRRYNGATLLGLKGIVIKSHGGADSYAFTHALEEAILEGEKGVSQRIAKEVEQGLAGRPD
jgi:glycerol-3-phosphate acyltransferase PlsX